MAKSQYSADSASLPQPPYPCDDNRKGTFKSAILPACMLPASVASGMYFYVGESADLKRRLLEHASVGRKASQSGTPTSPSID